MLRGLLIRASESARLEHLVTTRKVSRGIALRYVAGETLEQGLDATRELVRAGRTVTLDYLGESVSAEDDARAAAKKVLEALDRIGEEGLPAGVSVKPTQMGMAFATDLCAELLGEIADAAGRVDTHLTLDMEGSDVTEATVGLVERLQSAGHRDVGCAVQTYLHRTSADVERLSRLPGGAASLRLCKGAYAEPEAIAYQKRAEVDAAYATCADYLLEHGSYPRFATHDDALIDHVRNSAARLGVDRDAFEFQMLYGVRPSLQQTLVRDGYRLRIYVPFGDQWYPYFMRRLAERPANLLFFLRSLRDT
jgi:proline dehydrogenase